MINNAEYNLMMSEIYLNLTDNNAISLEQLTQYKNMVSEMPEFENKLQDSVPNLLRLIGSYVEKASKTMSKEVLLQHCTDILNAVNSNLCSFNVSFRLKTYEYLLCGELTPISERISILKAIITESTGESLDDRISFRTSLLDIYLSNPNDYIEDMRALSGELKSLIELRNAG